MKYGVKLEKELMTELWSGPIKDNPVNFVKYVFPWGQKDTPSKSLKDQGSGKKKFCEKWQYTLSETMY